MNTSYGMIAVLVVSLALWSSSCAVLDKLQPRLQQALKQDHINIPQPDPQWLEWVSDLHAVLLHHKGEGVDIDMLLKLNNPIVQAVFWSKFRQLDQHEQDAIIQTWQLLCEISWLGRDDVPYMDHVAAKVLYLQNLVDRPSIKTKQKAKRSHYGQTLNRLVLKKNNTIQVGARHHPLPPLFDRRLEEMSHAFQYKVQKIDIASNTVICVARHGFPYSKQYKTPWTLEYHAHTIIQPQLWYYLFSDKSTIDIIHQEAMKHLERGEMRWLVSLRDILVYHLIVGDEQWADYITRIIHHLQEYARNNPLVSPSRIVEYMTTIGDPKTCETAIDEELIPRELKQYIQNYICEKFSL